MHVSYTLDLRIALQRDRGISAAAQVAEAWLQPRERRKRRIGTHMLVAVENRQSELILHRNHGTSETPRVPRLRRTALAFQRVRIDLAAGMAVECRDQIGADTLRNKVGCKGNRRIGWPRASVRSHGNTGHRFHAASDGEIRFAGYHLRGGDVARFESGGAEATDLDSCHRVGISGAEYSSA